MINPKILDQAVRAAAEGIFYYPSLRQTRNEVLRTWLREPDALQHAMPMICAWYHEIQLAAETMYCCLCEGWKTRGK